MPNHNSLAKSEYLEIVATILPIEIVFAVKVYYSYMFSNSLVEFHEKNG